MIPASESTSLVCSDSLIRRSNILQAIIRLSNEQLPGLTRNELLLRCAEILLTYSNFSAGWIGRCVPETAEIAPLAFLQPGAGGKENHEVSRKLILLDGPLIESIQETAESGKPALFTDLDPPVSLPLAPQRVTYRSCTIWPFSHHDFVYGVVTIFSEQADGFPPDELKFLETTVADLSLTLYAHDVSVQLQFERDFNNEIIDSIQALMVSITPCGKILRFNAEAEKVTGHNQDDVLDS